MISAWSMFRDEDLPARPNATDTRGRSFHEHMVHQCVSEDRWFRTMLDVDVAAPPLPKEETRLDIRAGPAAGACGTLLGQIREESAARFYY